MIRLIALFTLVISGFSGIFFSKYNKLGLIFALILFIGGFFRPDYDINIALFKLNFTTLSTLICSVICCILLAIYQLSKIYNSNLNHRLGLLNIFAASMGLGLISENIWPFYISLEALGIISTIFVAENSTKSASIVYLYNKFASFVFLVGYFSDNSQLKSICFLISCLCKSAQFPFSYWLIKATDANILASIFIHSATIIGTGIIFVSKFHSIFDLTPEIYSLMTIVGLITSILGSIIAIFQTNIKKIIACLTISSAGLMFICCGIHQFNLSILYFICHAFFKAILFIVFAYTLEKLKHTDINKYYGVHFNMLLISILSCINFPLLCSSFVKPNFEQTLFAQTSLRQILSSEISNIFLGYVISNILTLVVFVKLFIQCSSKTFCNYRPVWFLLIISIPFCWISNSLLGFQYIPTIPIFEIICMLILYFIFRRQKKFTIHEFSFNIFNNISKYNYKNIISVCNKISLKKCIIWQYRFLYKFLYKYIYKFLIIEPRNIHNHILFIIIGLLILLIVT